MIFFDTTSPTPIENLTQKLWLTVFLTVFVILLGCLYYAFRVKQEDTPRRRQRLRYRIIYLSALILAIVQFKVWVDDFTRLMTMLGLVGAGLVVANKESLMNFVGWLVINWRNLFAEGDYVSILNYVGYVDHLGMLYFKLYEVNLATNTLTGKTIRVPNGLVINNSVFNHSSSNQLMQATLDIPVFIGGDVNGVLSSAMEILKELLAQHYRKLPLTALQVWRRYHQQFAHLVPEEPVYHFQLKTQDQLIQVSISFYCLTYDQLSIRNQFWHQFFLLAKTDPVLAKALSKGTA